MRPDLTLQDVKARGATLALDDLYSLLDTDPEGLTTAEANRRRGWAGFNELPVPRAVTWWMLALRQVQSPFMAILGFAMVLSWSLGDVVEAIFIAVVILLDVAVGVLQEWGAERSAAALRSMSEPHCLMLRDGLPQQLAARELVPGDVVLLESGVRVPAELRLITSQELRIDESALTGESLPVEKTAQSAAPEAGHPLDAPHLANSGTLVLAGRARGLVIATGRHTQMGRLAAALAPLPQDIPPLVQRMHHFARQVALIVLLLSGVLIAVETARGRELGEVAFLAIALAVSAIPEGLPIAITITLAVAVRRLSRRRVIVRKLVAVESLGACSYIATDKTGTLTENRLEIRRIVLPGQTPARPEELPSMALQELLIAGRLCNEATRVRTDDGWREGGDTVDLAFLRLADELEVAPAAEEIVARLPYESVRQGSAVWTASRAIVKGAPETILPRCHDSQTVAAEIESLAANGYKVLVVAAKAMPPPATPSGFPDELSVLGLVGLQDPIRAEVPAAIERCRAAGIEVAMITGDHPITALAIARELGLSVGDTQLVTGPQLATATGPERAALVDRGRVFARVDPLQKLAIVETLMARGEAVAVTGDGANDAPALKAAHVGVAMGQRGTDLARESSELILTDDHFASLVNGIEEGRVAYSNIRKVLHLLASTSLAEILLVVLSLVADQPVPLTAVQLLWLKLVAEGIQDVALAFEPAEGDELKRPPRPLSEPLLDRVQLQRIVLSALVMGGVSWGLFVTLLGRGIDLESARNQTLLLMVLFENVQAGVCRSETRSVFALNPLRSPLLLWGTVTATLVHIGAMHWPLLQRVLDLAPIEIGVWAQLLALTLSLVIVNEGYRWWRLQRTKEST